MSRGRLQALVRPDGRETRYDYDRTGLPCRENIDAFSERRVERNVRGQITCTVDPAGIETRYQYDRFGRLTVLVNPNNERWQFDYDAGHRLLAQSDFAGRRRQYRYNALGRLIAKETADSRTEYRYQARTLEVRRAPLALWQQARGEQPDWPETLPDDRPSPYGLLLRKSPCQHHHLWILAGLSGTSAGIVQGNVTRPALITRRSRCAHPAAPGRRSAPAPFSGN